MRPPLRWPVMIFGAIAMQLTFEQAARAGAQQCGMYAGTGRVPVVCRLSWPGSAIVWGLRWHKREDWWKPITVDGVRISAVAMFECVGGVECAVATTSRAAQLIAAGICVAPQSDDGLWEVIREWGEFGEQVARLQIVPGL